MKTLIRSLTLLLLLGLIAPLLHAKPSPSSTPLVIADFEAPDSAAVWKGLPAERTTGQASEGQHALKFVIPKWNEGDEPRPGVRLPFANGRGFPSKDFSSYGGIAMSIWVEGTPPMRLGMKLRDEDGEVSWTTHAEIQPGKWNDILLTTKEAGADTDIHRVSEIIVYSLRPTNSFTAIIDNLHLTPRDLPPVARFDLKYPNYRNWIFPGAHDVEVACEVEAESHGLNPRQLSLELTLRSASGQSSTRASFKGNSALASLKSSSLPPGDLTLEARLMGAGGHELAREQWPLRMLTAPEVSGLKSYVDSRNNLHVDGAPFFPIGWYCSVNTQHLAEIASSPFNCLLAYGTDNYPKSDMRAFLDNIQSKGLKLVYCMNDIYPTAKYFEGKTWEGISGNEAIASAVMAAYKDHPAIIAWYLNDEIPHSLLPQLTDYYARVKQADPGRPALIVLCNRSELPWFPSTTDLFGVDPYPIPQDPITRVSGFIDSARAAVRDRQSVWFVPQAFGWYQYNSTNTDRGHIPTAEELRTSRAPTREEERCMTYLGLIHGAKGLIYYCYYDMRVLPQYDTMWQWMKSIAGEVRQLSPTLLSTDTPGSMTVSLPGIHAALKRHGAKQCVMATNPTQSPSTATFTIKGAGSHKVSVLFENRTIQMRQGRFEDSFAPLAVHVYEWSE